MARELHMTVQQFLANTTSREIGQWMALRREEAKQDALRNLAAKAEAARARRR